LFPEKTAVAGFIRRHKLMEFEKSRLAYRAIGDHPVGRVINAAGQSAKSVSETSSSSLSIEAQLAFSMPWPIRGRYAFAGPVRRRLMIPLPLRGRFSGYFRGLALVKAFVCIEDPKLRRAIARLVEEIVPETGSSNED
jgi:hypothetical protein